MEEQQHCCRHFVVAKQVKIAGVTTTMCEVNDSALRREELDSLLGHHRKLETVTEDFETFRFYRETH